jgi:hypothetical protein
MALSYYCQVLVGSNVEVKTQTRAYGVKTSFSSKRIIIYSLGLFVISGLRCVILCVLHFFVGMPLKL